MVTIKHIDVDGDNIPDIIEVKETYNVPNVYFTRSISPESILNIFNIVNRDCIVSDRVAVKVHSGEPGNKNFIKPDLYKNLLSDIDATIVECNTAYNGKRDSTEEHIKVMKKHGWDKYPIDILDSEDQISLTVNSPIIISENYVGSHIDNYDSMLVLSHFKGHAMGGYGGALKNISIGLASSNGKKHIHRVAPDEVVSANNGVDQSEFIGAMADAASSILDLFSGRMIFINIMKNISVDCDCDAHAKPPCMDDIGILASTDPVALDKACLDIIYNWNLKGSDKIIERIESRNGRYIIKCMEMHGYKSIYNMINLDIIESIVSKRDIKENSTPIPVPSEKSSGNNSIASIDSSYEDDIDKFMDEDEE